MLIFYMHVLVISLLFSKLSNREQESIFKLVTSKCAECGVIQQKRKKCGLKVVLILTQHLSEQHTTVTICTHSSFAQDSCMFTRQNKAD